MSKGAIAMVASRAYRWGGSAPDSSQRKIAKSIHMDKKRITEACLVLDFAPDLADGVVDGTKTLDAAYSQAQGAPPGSLCAAGPPDARRSPDGAPALARCTRCAPASPPQNAAAAGLFCTVTYIRIAMPQPSS